MSWEPEVITAANGAWPDAMHAVRNSTGERRLADALRAICKRFDVDTNMSAEDAAKNVLEALGRDWMRLPVDADGVLCRIGDVLDWDGGRHEVMAVSEDCVWFDTDEHEVRLTCCESSECRHVQPDTVESLLEEFHGKLWSDDEEQMSLLEEYAERIRRACNG